MPATSCSQWNEVAVNLLLPAINWIQHKAEDEVENLLWAAESPPMICRLQEAQRGMEKTAGKPGKAFHLLCVFFWFFFVFFKGEETSLPDKWQSGCWMELSGLTPSFFFHVSWRGLITMFCRAAIEVLFNLKAAQRRRDSRGGGRTRRGKWIPFLWASDTRDVRSDLGSRRTLV